MKRADLLWSAEPARVLLEASALDAGLLLGLSLLHAEMPPSALARGLLLAACAGPALAALRLKVAPRHWLRPLLADGLMAAALAAGVALVTLGLGAALGLLANLTGALGGLAPTLALLAATGPLYFGLRLGVRLWLCWDRLRKRRLLWGLTHAHLVVVVAVIAGIVVLATIATGSGLPPSERPPQGPVAYVVSALALWLFPVVWTVALLGMVAIGLLLPPSVLVSYFVARRATVRLEMLARATRRLRGGDYGVRVPVLGEHCARALSRRLACTWPNWRSSSRKARWPAP